MINKCRLLIGLLVIINSQFFGQTTRELDEIGGVKGYQVGVNKSTLNLDAFYKWKYSEDGRVDHYKLNPRDCCSGQSMEYSCCETFMSVPFQDLELTFLDDELYQVKLTILEENYYEHLSKEVQFLFGPHSYTEVWSAFVSDIHYEVWQGESIIFQLGNAISKFADLGGSGYVVIECSSIDMIDKHNEYDREKLLDDFRE